MGYGKKPLELTNMRFGRLLVLNRCPYKTNGHTVWACKCDCGNYVNVIGSNLTRKNKATISCGCANSDLSWLHDRISEADKHLSQILKGMKDRCYNKKRKTWNRYGGKGIYVCKEWSEDVNTFRKWAKENGYKKGLTIDRIDNNGPYSPENCRWTDRKTQARNRASNHLYQGKTIVQWCEELGLNYASVRAKINKCHMSEELALGLVEN